MVVSTVSENGEVSAVMAQKEVYVQDQVSVSMFKKALDTQTQNAMALVESIPQVSSTQGLPSDLGNNINTTA